MTSLKAESSIFLFRRRSSIFNCLKFFRFLAISQMVFESRIDPIKTISSKFVSLRRQWAKSLAGVDEQHSPDCDSMASCRNGDCMARMTPVSRSRLDELPSTSPLRLDSNLSNNKLSVTLTNSVSSSLDVSLSVSSNTYGRKSPRYFLSSFDGCLPNRSNLMDLIFDSVCRCVREYESNCNL